MISLLCPDRSGPGLSPSQHHWVLLLGNKQYSNGASLYPGVSSQMHTLPENSMLWVT